MACLWQTADPWLCDMGLRTEGVIFFMNYKALSGKFVTLGCIKIKFTVQYGAFNISNKLQLCNRFPLWLQLLHNVLSYISSIELWIFRF